MKHEHSGPLPVKAELIQTLLAGLVDRVQPGAGVLLLLTVCGHKKVGGGYVEVAPAGSSFSAWVSSPKGFSVAF